MDKKAAEEAAMKAKEATGRALFESGTWKDDSDEDDDDDNDDEDGSRWNLEKMRKETERLQILREEARLKKGFGGSGDEDEYSTEATAVPSVNGESKDEGEG